MKTTLILLITILFISCENVPEKNRALSAKLNKNKALIGNWEAKPYYQGDSITLIHIDSLYGKIDRIIRFNSNNSLDLFKIDGDENVYSCGNTTQYTDESNWKLDAEKGLLYLDIFGQSLTESFHTKKSYIIESIRADTIKLKLYKTIVDEMK